MWPVWRCSGDTRVLKKLAQIQSLEQPRLLCNLLTWAGPAGKALRMSGLLRNRFDSWRKWVTEGKMGVACGILKSLLGRRGIKREGAVRKSEFSCSVLIITLLACWLRCWDICWGKRMRSSIPLIISIKLWKALLFPLWERNLIFFFFNHKGF